MALKRAPQETVGRAAVEVESKQSELDRALARFRGVAARAGAAHGLSGDDLDEVMQDVRIRLWRAGDAPGKLESLTPYYIYRAAASAATDLLRRQRARREQRMPDDPPLEQVPHLASSTMAADDAMISAETLQAIERALDTLALNRRAVVRMHLQGYSREEIAALLRWSEAKTRNLLYRGLEDLREQLRAKGVHT